MTIHMDADALTRFMAQEFPQVAGRPDGWHP